LHFISGRKLEEQTAGKLSLSAVLHLNQATAGGAVVGIYHPEGNDRTMEHLGQPAGGNIFKCIWKIGHDPTPDSNVTVREYRLE
jgi:hypothetical protein